MGDYALAWVGVFIMLTLFSFIAGTLGATTVWIFGIGTLVGWFGVALARFWGRMMWAYHLAQMEKKSTIAAGDWGDIPYHGKDVVEDQNVRPD